MCYTTINKYHRLTIENHLKLFVAIAGTFGVGEILPFDNLQNCQICHDNFRFSNF